MAVEAGNAPCQSARSGRYTWCGARLAEFGSQGGDTLVQRQHRPCGVTEPPDRDLSLFGLASADHEQERHLGEGALPDLLADLLVPNVQFGAEPGGIERGVHLPSVTVGVAGDRGDDDLAGRQPQRQLAGVVLDQDADEALEGRRSWRGAASLAAVERPSGIRTSPWARAASPTGRAQHDRGRVLRIEPPENRQRFRERHDNLGIQTPTAITDDLGAAE